MTMKIEGNPAELFASLAKARAQFKPVHFDNEGQIQNRRYKYATLAAVLESVTGPLCANGLVLYHTRGSDGEWEVFTHVLAHTSGSFIASEQRIPTTRTDEKGNQRRLTEQEFGSAYTYSRRYAIQGLLGIAAEEDDDGAEASKRQDAPRDRREAPTPRPEPKTRPEVGQRPASVPPEPDRTLDRAADVLAPEDTRPAQSDPDLDEALGKAFQTLYKEGFGRPAANVFAKQVTGKVPSAWTVSDGRKFLRAVVQDGERPSS